MQHPVLLAVADPAYPHITLQLQILVSESAHLPATQLMDVDGDRRVVIGNEQVIRRTGSDGIVPCRAILKLCMENTAAWNDIA